MKVYIRIFPKKENRRASFITVEVVLKNNTVQDLFNSYKDISQSTHMIARGVNYLELKDELIENEILNIISI